MHEMILFENLTTAWQQFLCKAFNTAREEMQGKEFAFINEQFDAPYHFSDEHKPVTLA